MPNDLEDFLRRAAQRRAENEVVRNEQRQRRAEAPRRRPEYTDRNAERQVTQDAEDDDDVVVMAEVVQTTPRAPESSKRQSVYDESGHAGNSGAYAGPTYQAAYDPYASDASLVNEGQRSMKEHLQQAFDHRVGGMDDSPTFAGITGTAPPPTKAAAEFVKMMRDPRGIRQAFILKEIIERPIDRW